MHPARLRHHIRCQIRRRIAGHGARPAPTHTIAAMPPRRWIAHLDMDAFYASVELLRYPELQGQPVVIGGGRRHQPELLPDGTRRFATLAGYAGRGVITTATYPARDLGVHSGMGLMKAALRAPQAVLLPTDFEQYRAYSRRFKAAVAELAPTIEDRGIDEIYIDLTDLPGAQDDGGPRPARRRARHRAGPEEQRAARHRAELQHRRDAQQAAEQDRQRPGQARRPEPADAGRHPGSASGRCRRGASTASAPRPAPSWRPWASTTIGQIAERDRAWLVQHFGAHYGGWLHDASHGVDDRPVVTHSEPVSMSRETTFDRDLHARRDKAELGAIFTKLAEQVAARPAAQGLPGPHHRHQAALRGLQDRDARHDRWTSPTADAGTIRLAAGLCLKRVDLERGASACWACVWARCSGQPGLG